MRARLASGADALRDGVLAARLWGRSGLARELRPRGLGALARGLRDLGLGPHLAVLIHAGNHPDKDAVVAGARRLSYAQLDAEVNRLGRALYALGASPGDRIALMLGNGVEQVVAQEALPRAGFTAVQIGTRLKAREVAHVLGNAEPQVVLFDEAFRDVIAEATELAGVFLPEQLVAVGAAPGTPNRYEELVASASDAPPARGGGGGGVIVYTSGTTGLPKGAARSWRDTGLVAVTDFLYQVGARTDERHLVVAPLYHSGAIAFAKMILGIGGTLVVLDHFSPEAVLAAIERERITSAFMVPTMLSRLCEDDSLRRRFDVSSLRWVANGAAPLSTELARRFQGAFGPILWNFYGATETGMVTLAGPADHEARPGTVGRPLRGNELRILDDDGEEVAPGEIGELYAKSSMLIAGYHGNDDATRASKAGDFFSVGDLARVDADGYLYLEARKHDMIISGGVNIYPREIEDQLASHPAVLEAAVIGAPDPEWGERVEAYVVCRPGGAASADELIEHCRRGLADFKRPRRVVFVDELPRTATGKILKRELRSA